MDNKLIAKLAILGFLFISVIGTLSHFVYEWSGYNHIVGAFFAVNESVWEHIKMAIIPSFMWLLIECFIIKDRFFKSKLVSFLTIIISIPLLFYTYFFFLNKEVLILDIIIFYISIALGQCVFYYTMKKCKNTEISNNVSALLLVIMFITFITFTYITPKLDIFKDPNTNTYGISSNK